VSNKSAISIIMPVYNREEIVKTAIASVKAQTYPNWELLLIDDGSSDGTVKVINQHAVEDVRIRCLKNTHKKGPSGARNQGLDDATGKYIAYQDSDDEWIPTHLEAMVNYLEKYPTLIDLMTANPLRKYVETGEVFNYDELALDTLPVTPLDDGYLFDSDKIFDIQLRGRAITTQCLVGKAELMKSVRWNESSNAAVDIMHNLELCAKNIKVCHIQEYQAIYWAHDDNLTNCGGGHSPERMERVHNAFALYWETVLSKLTLSTVQIDFVKDELSKVYAWHLAFHTYLPQKKYKEAALFYKKATKLKPLKFKYWKGLIKTRILSLMG
jgi:glycosyltransferase involved in cell wall biosynthesis